MADISGGFDEYKLKAVVSHEPYFVEHRFLDDRLPAELQRSGQVQRWEREKELGRGSFGVVWLEKLQRGRQSGPTVRAVKAVQKSKMKDKRELIALSDFSTRKHIRSGYFVEFYGWFEDSDAVYIAMEYFPLGTLNLFIDQNASLPENEIRMITGQLLLGLALIHEQNYAHRDLKPENIFIDTPGPRWSVKIGDFGISKHVKRTGTELRTGIGTPLYTAPEIHGDVILDDEEDYDKYTNKVDLWSLGCVVFEMVARSIPFPKWPLDYKKCCRGLWFPTQPDHLSENGWQFVKSILVPDPRQRLSAVEALRHDWITSAGLSTVVTGAADPPLAMADTDRSAPSLPRSVALSKHPLRQAWRKKDFEWTKHFQQSSPSKSFDSKLARGSFSLMPNSEVDLARLEIGQSSAVAEKHIPVPREHKTEQETDPMRALDSENDIRITPNRARPTFAAKTYKRAEKIRQDLVQLARKRKSRTNKEPWEIIQQLGRLTELASIYHSEGDYLELEEVNQKILEVYQQSAQKYPWLLDDELGFECLDMIAAVYEEQEKYDDAVLVYEKLYYLQNEDIGIPGRIYAVLQTRDRISSIYGKQTPNLRITMKSAEGFWSPTLSTEALFLELEIPHPITQSNIWRTKATRDTRRPRWDMVVEVKADPETTLTFNLYSLRGMEWASQGGAQVQVGDVLNLETRCTVPFTLEMNENKPRALLLTFSTDFATTNAKMTQSVSRLSKVQIADPSDGQ